MPSSPANELKMWILVPAKEETKSNANELCWVDVMLDTGNCDHFDSLIEEHHFAPGAVINTVIGLVDAKPPDSIPPMLGAKQDNQPDIIQAASSQQENQQLHALHGLKKAQVAEKQRLLMLHIKLIEHTSGCRSSTCPSKNCAEMKQYLHHIHVCEITGHGGCKICQRIRRLVEIHAEGCKDDDCPVPHCVTIRMQQLYPGLVATSL